MKINIVADSSCDIKEFHFAEGDNEVTYTSIPFNLEANEKEFVDDENLSINDLLYAMEHSDSICRTACPAPGLWMDKFESMDNVIALTISENLSGSYASALSAKGMIDALNPDKNLAVLNSISTGPGIIVIVNAIVDAVKQGKNFNEIVDYARAVAKKKETLFAITSFDNLIRNGRMGYVAAAVAKTLNFTLIGYGTKEGRIEVLTRVRGSDNAIKTMVDNMKSDDIADVAISHCNNLELAQKLEAEVKKKFPNAKTSIYETRGLDSFYAERNGVIIAYI